MKITWAAMLAAPLTVLTATQGASAQMSRRDLAKMGKVVSQVKRIETNLGPRAKYVSSGIRNLMNVADRWNQIRPILEGSASPSEGQLPQTSSAFSASVVSVSSPSALGKTRLGGFTQSETSTAWCNQDAVVAFNDSGSYAWTATSLFSLGASFESYAASNSTSNPPSFSFTYQQPPLYPLAGPGNWLLGDPTVVCTGSTNPPTFYLATIVFQYSNSGTLTATGVAVFKSTGGGSMLFFGSPAFITLPYPSRMADKPWLAIDPKTPSNLYVTFTDFDDSGACGTTRSGKRTIPIPGVAIVLASSNNGGLSWTTRTVHEVCGNIPFVQGSQVAVGPDHNTYVAWESLNSNDNGATYQAREIDIANSSNSFATTTKVSAVNYAGDSYDLQGNIRDFEFPSMAIAPTLDGTSNKPDIYIAWNDGDTSMPDSISSTGQYHFTDILVTGSADGSATWSAPARINQTNTSGQTDQYQPALAVDKTGKVEVCYYDRHNDSNNFMIQRSCVSGTNYDNTITPTGFPSVIGQDLYVAFDYMGDYDTLTADSTGTYPGFFGAFGDNATGNPEVQANTE